MISHYSFGRIVVGEREFRSDIIIYPDGTIDGSWRRRTGHSLCSDDIKQLVESSPQTIIAGTGSPGYLKPDEKLEKELGLKQISFRALPTKEAVALYNELHKSQKVGACLHLTC